MYKRWAICIIFILSSLFFLNTPAFSKTPIFGPPISSLQGVEVKTSILKAGYEGSKYETLTFTLDIEKAVL
ncbi:hypothetical protein J7K43_08835 [Candidatus Calescamantes bacterium]|nr:hypothetical protein [Candidatus Calescamantes bacterium]